MAEHAAVVFAQHHKVRADDLLEEEHARRRGGGDGQARRMVRVEVDEVVEQARPWRATGGFGRVEVSILDEVGVAPLERNAGHGCAAVRLTGAEEDFFHRPVDDQDS